MCLHFVDRLGILFVCITTSTKASFGSVARSFPTANPPIFSPVKIQIASLERSNMVITINQTKSSVFVVVHRQTQQAVFDPICTDIIVNNVTKDTNRGCHCRYSQLSSSALHSLQSYLLPSPWNLMLQSKQGREDIRMGASYLLVSMKSL